MTLVIQPHKFAEVESMYYLVELLSFFFGGSKLFRNLAKNQHTLRKSFHLVNKIYAELTKIGRNFRKLNVSKSHQPSLPTREKCLKTRKIKD